VAESAAVDKVQDIQGLYGQFFIPFKLRLTKEVRKKQHIKAFCASGNGLFDTRTSPPWPMEAKDVTAARSEVWSLLDRFVKCVTSVVSTYLFFAHPDLQRTAFYISEIG
jgi:hypothetical protein